MRKRHSNGNNIVTNERGVELDYSSNNTIARNEVTANNVGIILWHSSNNTVSENKIIKNNEDGAYLVSSSNNRFYHNNFIDNPKQVGLHETGYTTVWDDGYPSGGNYWSDLNPPDEDLDQIGDTPYVIDEDNLDRYPLIYPYGFVPSPDVNDDGTVNIKDLFLVARAFGTIPGESNWNPIADVTMDEIINIRDLFEVAKDYGKTV